MTAEIELTNINRQKGGYRVSYTPLADAETETTYIHSDLLRQHVKDFNLYNKSDVQAWIDANEEYVIQHYLTDKL